MMSVTDWLERASTLHVHQALRNDAYSVAYPELVNHFTSIKNDVAWNDFVVGLHVVYAWMPTIPDLERICSTKPGCVTALDNDGKKRVIAALKAARDASQNVTADRAAELLSTLSKYINGSLVGASKLLHFLNPEVFPIWDSRVARRFLRTRGRPTNDKMKNLNLWRRYFEATADWRSRREVIQKCDELRGLSGCLGGATNTRIIELVLFHPAPDDRDEVKDT